MQGGVLLLGCLWGIMTGDDVSLVSWTFFAEVSAYMEDSSSSGGTSNLQGRHMVMVPCTRACKILSDALTRRRLI